MKPIKKKVKPTKNTTNQKQKKKNQKKKTGQKEFGCRIVQLIIIEIC